MNKGFVIQNLRFKIVYSIRSCFTEIHWGFQRAESMLVAGRSKIKFQIPLLSDNIKGGVSVSWRTEWFILW